MQLHRVRRLSSRENESQVARPLGQRNQQLPSVAVIVTSSMSATASARSTPSTP